ncbi:hypothetical protein J2T20_002432 [Paenibacillus wynnii]|nr:hypothetical protein [Paenibacillus wynnii]
MRIVIILVLYTIAFYWGCKQLGGKGRKRHCLWYGCILTWCAYKHISGSIQAPSLSVSSLYIAFFQPAGKAIIQWLGG